MVEPAQKAFVQLLPPPNVTGRLHMGHMLNQTEMDILARWHSMLGEPSVWVPGTDHAGIATQMMVERQLAAEGGPSRQEMGREAFTAPRVVLEEAVRRGHHRADAKARRQRRLVARVLHHG